MLMSGLSILASRFGRRAQESQLFTYVYETMVRRAAIGLLIDKPNI